MFTKSFENLLSILLDEILATKVATDEDVGTRCVPWCSHRIAKIGSEGTSRAAVALVQLIISDFFLRRQSDGRERHITMWQSKERTGIVLNRQLHGLECEILTSIIIIRRTYIESILLSRTFRSLVPNSPGRYLDFYTSRWEVRATTFAIIMVEILMMSVAGET